MPVKTKIEGISGADSICTILPYEVLKISEREDPETQPPPKEDITERTLIESVIEFIKKLIELFKK